MKTPKFWTVSPCFGLTLTFTQYDKLTYIGSMNDGGGWLIRASIEPYGTGKRRVLFSSGTDLNIHHTFEIDSAWTKANRLQIARRFAIFRAETLAKKWGLARK